MCNKVPHSWSDTPHFDGLCLCHNATLGIFFQFLPWISIKDSPGLLFCKCTQGIETQGFQNCVKSLHDRLFCVRRGQTHFNVIDVQRAICWYSWVYDKDTYPIILSVQIK